MKVWILYAVLTFSALCVSDVYASDVEGMLTQAAHKHNISPEIVKAVAKVESNKTCGLKDGPHRGIMQVSRSTAKEVGMPWPFLSCEDEIEAGVRYLEKAIAIGGENCVGITLYNSGINAGLHCSQYGKKVMREARSQ